MSVKRIEAALDQLSELRGEGAVRAARTELGAVVQAAQDIEAFGEVGPASTHPDEVAAVDAAARLLSKLAKEAD